MSEEIKKPETEEATPAESAEITESAAQTAEAAVSDNEKEIPLDFSYYKKSDGSGSKRLLIILFICAVVFVILAGFMSFLNDKTNKPLPEFERTVTDAYPGSPYAYDTAKIADRMTDDGLYYTEYTEHIRITGYRDILYPFDLTVPDTLNGKPVTEIDYYVFSYSVLNSLTISNPECMFFEDGEMPPVDTKVMIIAYEGSKAQETAEKYGNPFKAPVEIINS